MIPRGVRWGLRAPKPAPKSHWLSGLSSFGSWQSTSLPNLAITAIPEFSHPRPAALGYTERPDRLQFMAGQVELYSNDSYYINRPDSSRPPSGAESGCSARSGEETALRSPPSGAESGCTREAVCQRALPASISSITGRMVCAMRYMPRSFGWQVSAEHASRSVSP